MQIEEETIVNILDLLPVSIHEECIYRSALRKAETEPKIAETSMVLFTQLKNEGFIVPDILKMSLASRAHQLKRSIDRCGRYQSLCKTITPFCGVGSGVAMGVTWSIHPWLGMVTGALSCFCVFTTNHYFETCCPYDELAHKDAALKLRLKLKDAFLEAVNFSAANGKELPNILENRIKKLNTDMKQSSNYTDRKELNRLSVIATLALADLRSIIDHYKLEGFSSEVSNSYLGYEILSDTESDTEELIIPLIRKKQAQTSIIELNAFKSAKV